MSPPFRPPPPKDPLRRTRRPTLPPAARSRAALGLLRGAAIGRLELQQCGDCGAVAYPPREACPRCLSDRLAWRVQPAGAALLSATVLRHSNELYFRERTPWRVGLVKLDAGPTAVVHLHGDVPAPPARLRIRAMLDRAGQAVLVGLPEHDTPNMADDPMLREHACDPRHRKVLVTEGKSAIGQAMVRALAEAGAATVWVGEAEPWKRPPGYDALLALPVATAVPLDVTEGGSVAECARVIGGKVDIVVNTARMQRAEGIASRRGLDVARAEMEVNAFGLLRLAQEFGPALCARAADGPLSAVAWVNILSVQALAAQPAAGTFSASQAAALALAQTLRAEMAGAGVRVVNVFPGPVEDEWNQLVPPPKLAPAALARAVVAALRDGVEDAFPGDIAQDWLARLRDNPKGLERELAAGGG